MGASTGKLRVFVASTHTDLRPYREKVIQRLKYLDYTIVANETTQELPTQRLKQIENCDLFIGIFPPESGVLPDPLPGSDYPLPLLELRQVAQTSLDCLIYIADPELSGLEILQPAERKPVYSPRSPELDPLPPPKTLQGPAYWMQAIRAWLWREQPPDKINDEIRKKHVRREALLLQKQRQQEQLEAEAATAFPMAQQQYQTRRAFVLELLKEMRQFPHRHFGTQNELLSQLWLDLNYLKTSAILPFARNRAIILKSWQAWLDYHLQEIQNQLYYPHVLQFASPAETLLGDFLNQQWHETAQAAVHEVTTAVTTLCQSLPNQDIRSQLTHYQQAPFLFQTGNYAQITQKLIVWCANIRKTMINIEQWVVQQRDSQGQKGHIPYVSVWEENLALWQTRVDILERLLAEDSYGKCLLVTGRSGSGKSHFVARLLRQHEEESGSHLLHCLYVSPKVLNGKPAGKPAIETLLTENGRFSFPGGGAGPSWHSFTELAHFGGADSGNKLIVVFDDLDTWRQQHQLDIADLQQFIKSYTHLHNVYWVLCIAENHFDVVAGPHHERFWNQYAFGGSTDTSLGGWIVLDRLNEAFQPWRKIVAYQLQRKGTDSLAEIVAPLDEQSKKLVQIPFVAWLFGRLLREGKLPDELQNVNYIEFATAFWRQRLIDVLTVDSADRSSPISEAVYWRTIYLTAGLVIRANNTLLSQLGLPEKLAIADDQKTPGFVEAVHTAVDRLVDVDLLVNSTDPAAIARYGNLVRPGGFPPIWQWKSGEYLVEALRPEKVTGDWSLVHLHRLLDAHYNEEELRTLCFELGVDYENLTAVGKAHKARELVQLLWRTDRVRDLVAYGRKTRPRANWDMSPGKGQAEDLEVWLQEQFITGWPLADREDYLPGVLEFFILLLEQDRLSPWPQNFVRRVIQAVLSQLPDYQNQVWLAASKASSATQYTIAAWLQQTGPAGVVQKKHLHPYLYFLKYAAGDEGQQRGVSAVLRMQLLQPFYREMRKDAYLAGLLLELVEKASNGRDAARALAYLHGIEPYLGLDTFWPNAANLAQWVYGRLLGLAQKQVTIPPYDGGYQWELFCLVHEWLLVLVDEIAGFRPQRGTLDEYDQKYWIQVIRCHCQRFAPLLTLDRLNWLEETGWFASERWPDVQYILGEQLTNSCGQWFREGASRRQKQEYATAVQHWAAHTASTSQKLTALYLIYHTIPSDGAHAGRRLEPALQQIFDSMHADPDWKIQEELKKPHVVRKLTRR